MVSACSGVASKPSSDSRLTSEDRRDIDVELNHDAIDAQLASLLRDQPPGTTANLTNFAVAYWDGQRVVYVFLDEHDDAKLDEEFDRTDRSCSNG